MNVTQRSASLLCACLFCFPLFAQTDFNLDLTGSVFDFWCDNSDIEIVGDYAYVSAVAAGLFIIDISDPEHPIQVGHFRCDGNVLGATAVGDYAYLAAGHLGLIVLDISDRSHPFEIGRRRVYDAAYNVDITGHYAYVSAYDDGLKIIDISDPFNPDQVATFGYDSEVKNVTIVGNLCYAACGRDGMRILNISDPEEPIELGQFETPGSPHDSNHDIALYGHTAIMACLTYGAFFVNVSDPTNPYMVYHLTPETNFLDVAVRGNIAYFADHTSGVNAYNISNPAEPAFAGNYLTLGRVDNIKIAGNIAYVLDFYTGLHLVDLDDHHYLEELSNINEGSTWETKKVGNLIYAACGFDGLHVIDASDPANPVDIGCYDSPRSQTFGVDVVGNYAYLADWADGLRIIDISDPSNPEFVSELDTPGYVGCLDVGGNYAYMAVKYDGLWIVDVSNPESPVALGSVLLDHPDVYHDEQAFDVDVDLPYAYVTNYAGGLRIIDVSDPNSPFEIGFINDMPFNNVCISDTIAYCSFGDGFHVISISDPTHPCFIYEYRDSDFLTARGIAIQDNYLFLVNSATGLFVYDVSSPTAPIVTAHYDTEGLAIELEVEGNFTYVTDSYTVSIFDHSAAIQSPISTLSGAVRDSCTHQPIAGAEVILTSYHEYRCETDAEGNYYFDFLFPLTYAISISADGFVTYEDSMVVSEGANEHSINLVPNPEFEAIGEEEYHFTVPHMGAAIDSFVIRNIADCSVDLEFRVIICGDNSDCGPLNQEWLAISIDEGMLAAGEQTQIQIIIDASLDSLDGGYWDGYLYVETNDPVNRWFGTHVMLTVEPESASETTIPTEFAVSPPYPNPFNPTVTIPFSLPNPGAVTMNVFNIMGQSVYSFDKPFPAGSHSFVLNTQSDGMNLSSGMYFIQIRYQDQIQTCKVMLMK